MQDINKETLSARLTYATLMPMALIPLFVVYSRLIEHETKHLEELFFIFRIWLAMILTFVGGINWCLGIGASEEPGKKLMLSGVLIPMLGWSFLLIGYPHVSLFSLICLYIFQIKLDEKFAIPELLGTEFYRLRKISYTVVISFSALMLIAA